MGEEKEKFGDKPVFDWKSVEFAREDRGADWYLMITAAALVIIGLLFWEKMWSGIAFVVVAYVYLLITVLKPKKIECKVFKKGIVVDDRVYEFDQIKDFWFIDGIIPKFYFLLQGKMAGQIMMPAKGAEAEKIRSFLKEHLPEEKRGEDLIEKINRWIKF